MNAREVFRRISVAGLLFCSVAVTNIHAALIGFYPFDDTADPRKDESTAAPVPGLGLALQSSDPAADPVYAAAGGLGGTGAYQFDGTQRLITGFDIGQGTYPALTMGAWVKPSSTSPGLRRVIGHDDGGWDRAIGLDTRQAGIFGYSTFTGAGVLNSERAPASTNDWAFIAATYDQTAGRVAIYVDPDVASGGPLITRTGSGRFGEGLAQAAIGSLRPDAAAESWLGSIDNVFFFDQVLSEAQLTAIRDGGKNAVLGGAASDNPNLGLVNAPNISALPKLPEIRSLPFVITNSGASTVLNIRSVTITGPDAGHFTVENFPPTLAAQAGGTINVQFNNRGQVGTFSALMNIVSDDQSTTNFVIELNPRVAQPALLGFYSFDDAAAPLKDDSSANRNLTGTVIPTHDPAGGIEGGAMVFDGTQRLAAPIDINPGPVPNLTMGAWVKTDAFEGLHKIMGHDNGGWDRTLGLDNRGADGATYYTAFAGQGVYPQTVPLAVPESTEAWTFVAAVYEQSRNLVTTYVDLDASSTNDALLTGSTNTTIGTGVASVGIGGIAPTGTGEAWLGSIDNAFFINGALDADQMALLRALKKGYLTSLKPDPILGGPSTLAFGELPTASPITANIRILNTGATQPLRISRAQITGADAGLYSLGALPAEIAPGGEATIPVTLTPGSRTGGVDAQLILYSNNAGNRVSTINLVAFVPFASARAALIGFYPFDNASAPLQDASGSGANASEVPDFVPTFDPAGGISGGAYVFAGAERLNAPVNINPAVNPKLTMGAWVKTSDLEPLNRKIMGHDDGGWDRAIGIDIRGTGGLTTHHYTAFAGRDAYARTEPPATPVSADEWTFIAGVYNQFSNTVTTFIDLNVATTNDTLLTGTVTTTMGGGAGALGIGAISATSGEFWIGSIDNVFVYRTTLTPEQITAIRNGGAAAILATDTPAGDFRITAVQRGADFRLTWESVAGRSYRVQYSEVVTGPFQDIATLSATGPSTTHTDTDATRLGRRTGFYRIFQP